MNIEKETFVKLVEMGWTPPQEKPKKYKLSEYGFRVYQDGYHEYPSNVCTNWGVTRKTETYAKLAFARSWATMRLSALAAELGGEKKFIEGEDNFYIFQDKHKWVIGLTLGLFHPEKVYMNAKCAREICRMLNAGEFKL